MAGAAATSALFDLLFEKLASGTIKQFGKLLGVQRDLKKLKSRLSAIRSVIQDAENMAVTNNSVRDWVDKLRDAVYDADDLLDEFHTELERRKCDSLMSKKVRIFFSPSNPLAFRINMCFKIKTIVDKLDMIDKERICYKFGEYPVSYVDTTEGRMTAAEIDDTTVYGRDDDLKNIVELLLQKETDREDLSVVTIVGMGGLGKTTLAQLAYNHEKVVKQESFHLRIWVCVSHKFDILRIGRAIMEYVKDKKCDLSELATVKRDVRQMLAGKKFLLVLDDVWNDNQTLWEELKEMLVSGAKGSKIIVTTRSDKVAAIMSTVIEPYHLGRLAEEDCWKLFKHRAFSTEEDTERDPSLEAIGREIVAKCGGSALAVKALGSLMRFKRGRQEWLAVRDSNTWISTDEGERVMASLRLSYNHLSPRLKQCFDYCSIFPKDSWIDRYELILQWIAQGFIPSDASSHAVDVGNEYFNNLVMMSFLEKYSKKSYEMHDLVHDLTQSVAGDEYFIRYADKKEPTPQRYRFCSLVGELEASELKDFFQESRTTRALRLQCKSEISSCIMFSRLQRLRVLDIKYCSQIKELHGSINRLKHLRYLNIENISEMPNSIGELLNLQALIMFGCTNLRLLPQSFTKLHKLIALDLSGCDNLESLPESLDSLQSLLTLSLKGCSSLVSLPESIGKLANLRCLQLSGCSELVSLPQSLSLHRLVALDLSGCYNLGSLPESLDSLQSLLTLSLKACERLVSLPESIGKLANLRTLQLSRCYDLGMLPQSLSKLSNLQELGLRYCKKIAELPEGMENMTSLIHLKNRGMWSLKGMPSGMGQIMRRLVTLERFAVGVGSNHSSIVELEHLNLVTRELELSNLENVKSPVDAAMAKLKEKRNLRRLSLEWSDRGSSDYDQSIREEVVAELMPHPNLEALEIVGYPGIKLPNWSRTMGGSESALPNLVELCFRDMPDLEEWSTMTASVLLYPHLVKLHIENCPKMHVEPWIPASVEELILWGDVLILGRSRVEGLPSPSSPPPPLLRLRKLTINKGSPDVWNRLQYMISNATLEELTIFGMEMVDLPEAIRRFTSLRVLDIYSCSGLARLPEWLADLTSLKELSIIRCSRSLKERCEKDTGEDWPKIAHIPNVLFIY